VGEYRPQELPGMAPRSRRRLTIGVSMVLLAALAVPMAWVSNHARTQDRALVAIGRAGGFVIYDFQRDPEGMILNEGSSDPSLSWLRKVVPAHYYRDFNVASLRGTQADDDAIGQIAGLGQIEELYLNNSRVTDAGLAQLRGLKHLKFLDLVGTQVTDAGVAHLSRLRELTYLRLSGTPVTDAGLAHLSGLRELRTLILDGTQVTDVGLAQLTGQDQLIKLSLDRTQVGDAGLEHLESHERLISVCLSGTRVSPAGVAKLKAALPKLQYIRYP
jgi:Leucine-rich repeat (LRR) protein